LEKEDKEQDESTKLENTVIKQKDENNIESVIDLEKIPISLPIQEKEKISVLGFENMFLLKIVICSMSISLFFFFIFLRGNILLKSFANIT